MKPAVLLAVVFSGVTLVSQAAESNSPTAAQLLPEAGPAIVIELKELGTGQPVPGIKLGSAFNGREPIIPGVTDAAGRSTLPLPKDDVKSLLVETVASGGWVQMQWYWRRRADDEPVPQQVAMVMEQGTPIGGKVVDDADTPIANATVTLNIQKKYSEWQRAKLTFLPVRTKADGKWSYIAPAGIESVQLGASHPQYVSGPGYYEMTKFDVGAVREGTATLRLDRGVLIEGLVRDPAGQPVVRASVGYGQDRVASNVLPEQKTDKQGRFACAAKPGDTAVLTVKAAGFAPELKQFIVVAGMEPVVFDLQPSHSLTGHVVDVQGQPIAGAMVYVDTWRGARTLNVRLHTDAEGRFTYKDAPVDPVEVDVYKPGYADNRNVTVVVGGENQIVLRPPTDVTGTVVDAESGQPLTAFRVITGIGWGNERPILWQRGNADEQRSQGKDGKFEKRLTFPYPKYAIRIEAEGYLPADSEPFVLDGIVKTLSFRMVKGAGLTGVVQRLDGAPVGDAQLLLATTASGVQIHNGRVPEYGRRDVQQTTSGTNGAFSFPPQTDAFVLVAIHATGYAQVSDAGLKTNSQITLQPWATVRGIVKTGTRVAPRQVVGLHYRDRNDYDPQKPHVYVEHTVVADADGRFEFDRVMAGQVAVSKNVRISDRVTGWSGSTSVTVTPGEAVAVSVGGEGRPVVGRLELPVDLKIGSWMVGHATVMSNIKAPKFESPAGVKDLPPEEQAAWFAKWKASPAGTKWFEEQRKYAEQRKVFAVCVEGDGSFRVDDVPAGDYRLQVSLAEPPVGRQCGPGEEIATVMRTFTVPPIGGGVSDEPFDLATVPVMRIKRLKLGAAVPAFAVKTLDGKEIKLQNFKGQYVLLDFWATWCGPCRAEMPHLKSVYDDFGKDRRFVMIGLSMDETADTAKNYVTKNDLRWLQGFVGQGEGPQVIPKLYGVRGIPAVFLIDPDGKLLAKDLRGPAIKPAIAAALRK